MQQIAIIQNYFIFIASKCPPFSSWPQFACLWPLPFCCKLGMNQLKGELIAKMEEQYQKEQQKMEQYQKEQKQNMEQHQKEQLRVKQYQKEQLKMEQYQKEHKQKMEQHQKEQLKIEQYQKERKQKMEQHQKEQLKMKQYQKEQLMMEQYQKEHKQKMEQYQNKQKQNTNVLSEEQKENEKGRRQNGEVSKTTSTEHRHALTEAQKGNAGLMPQQNRLKSAACHEDITFSGTDRLIVQFTGENSTWRSVFAEKPIPKSNFGIFYYEVAILEQGLYGIHIGLGTKQKPLNRWIGENEGSYAYERYGRFYGHAVGGCSHTTNGRPYIGGNPEFGIGDVICGVDLATCQIIYTKNGQRLKTTGLFVSFVADLFPCVTLFQSGDKIEENFGPNFEFKF
uniref:B30.2/SPRY domain-containing protein n=1 Tax=Globodera rostochiensis TaxID=31243 RepID=A0A914HZ51_GLORO